MSDVLYGRKVPYGKKGIGRLRPTGDQTDAQVAEPARSGPLAGTGHVTYHGVPPVKRAPFQIPYIPLYFWVGGLAAGSWLAVTAESWTGEEDRDLVRAGRYVTVGSVLAGTGLLIKDLGRPDRFLNMLRVFRPRSPMSLGSWALSTFGGYAGAAALLQAAEDGWFGDRPRVARLSSGLTGRMLHLVGLPAALFVGSYTGVLLSATSTPSWATRNGTLARLFVASATSSGLAAVSAVLEAGGGTPSRTAGRLARAQATALGAEGALHLMDLREAKRMPSWQEENGWVKALTTATLAAGIALPLLLNLAEARQARRTGGEEKAEDEPGGGERRRSGRRLLAAGLALAGSLALRFTTVKEGNRSASTPADTWAYAGDGRARGPAEAPGQDRRGWTGGRSRHEEEQTDAEA